MAFVPLLASVSSTLFRVVCLTFLRIVPTPLAKFILPPLYLTFVVSSLFGGGKPPTTNGYAAIENEKLAKAGEQSAQSEKHNNHVATATNASNVNRNSTFLSLVLHLPSASKSIRKLSFIMNTILLLFAIDLVLSPVIFDAQGVVFTRVGAVDEESAKIVVRYPQENSTEGIVRLLYRPLTGASANESWKNGPSFNLSVANDWTSTQKIHGLWPSTDYEYKLVSGDTSETLPYPAQPLPFRTFPDYRIVSGSRFSFVVSSCVTPNFPYMPFKRDRIKGFDLLADYVLSNRRSPSSKPETVDSSTASQEPSPVSSSSVEAGNSSIALETNTTEGDTPANVLVTSKPSHKSRAPTEFMLFLGDFIYADVPLYAGDNKEAYRRLYRRNYASPSFRKLYERLPIFHIFDDHEIINNFAGQSNDTLPPFQNATSAYDLYNGDANFDPTHKGEYYYDFRYGDIAFFVTDTRHHRSDIFQEAQKRTMLGEKQAAALHAWLGRVNQTATFKFIISSVPFTSLWQHDAQKDSWAAFEDEKDQILSVIHSVPNVIILSGDRHEFAAIEFNGPQSQSYPAYEFSTSPLSMFYVPFYRTLELQSKRLVERTYTVNDSDKSVSVSEWIPEERVMKYIATGNYKWSSFDIDTQNPEEPVINIEVMIDGASSYRHQIRGVPVKLKPSTALGAFIPQSFKGVLDRMGLRPDRWF